eukprot:TRINITY_DN26361_c0_g1_i1.p1 TRINITY_DN26361_c0_g1~~TRINITY_DN26361_c0_g1_i1.p1  ORF type:complete len:183 (+),score=12.35 TRINITY_DN26361_c0_g1_i1:29-550(+)
MTEYPPALDPEHAPAIAQGILSGNHFKTKNTRYLNEVAIFNKLTSNPYRFSDHDIESRSFATNFARGGIHCNKGQTWIRDIVTGVWFRKDHFDRPSLNYTTRKAMDYNPGLTCYLQGRHERPGLGTDETLRRCSSAPGLSRTAMGEGRATGTGDLGFPALPRWQTIPGRKRPW